MEFNEKSLNIQIKLINGSTFSIYVGTNIGGELMSKYKTPFYNCSKEERKYIQAVENIKLQHQINSKNKAKEKILK